MLGEVCEFLGIAYRPEMADPYRGESSRMVDGLHAESRMLGDVKFHQHSGVSREAAERWREAYREDFLGESTWELASRLGYPPPRQVPPLVPVPRGVDLPLSYAQERLVPRPTPAGIFRLQPAVRRAPHRRARLRRARGNSARDRPAP